MQEERGGGGICYRGRYYEPQALWALNGLLAVITEEMNFICPLFLLNSILRHRECSPLMKSRVLSSIGQGFQTNVTRK